MGCAGKASIVSPAFWRMHGEARDGGQVWSNQTALSSHVTFMLPTPSRAPPTQDGLPWDGRPTGPWTAPAPAPTLGLAGLTAAACTPPFFCDRFRFVLPLPQHTRSLPPPHPCESRPSLYDYEAVAHSKPVLDASQDLSLERAVR